MGEVKAELCETSIGRFFKPPDGQSSLGAAQECQQKLVGLLSEMAILAGKLLQVDPPNGPAAASKVA